MEKNGHMRLFVKLDHSKRSLRTNMNFSQRYERLCSQSDLELQISSQALHLDYSIWAVDTPKHLPPYSSSEIFSSLSPTPPHSLTSFDSSKTDSDLRPLPTAIFEPLICAALATRNGSNVDRSIEKSDGQSNIMPFASEQKSLRRCNSVEERSAPKKPDVHRNSNTSFHTARSRLLRSRLNTTRTGSDIHSGRSDLPPAQSLSASPLDSSQHSAGFKRPRLSNQGSSPPPDSKVKTDDDIPEIQNVDPKLVELIMNETLEKSPEVDWDDIAGLHFAKRCVMEAVVWPMLRPDIFSGLRGPPKGLLLFGPPGTGKTMIGRAIASKSGSKFFNISASSLVSKWAGEGEKTVRALFAVARVFQPSVIFIDEIDSLLTQRSDGEQEHSRRIKTEFLVQMDGAGTSREDRVLVVGATNRPHELDEAARRRLVKRLYIPLPDSEARGSLVNKLMKRLNHSLSNDDVDEIAKLSNGYSGSDMYALCAEAALGPVRELGEKISSIDAGSVRSVGIRDFNDAIQMVRASVSTSDLDGYMEWNKKFGSFSILEKVESSDKGGTTTHSP